jgi:hypothetical protein
LEELHDDRTAHDDRRSGLMRGYELGRWLAITVPLCFIVVIYLVQGDMPPLVLLATAVLFLVAGAVGLLRRQP